MNPKQKIKSVYLSALILTAVIMYFLFSQISAYNITEALKNLDYRLILIGFLFYVLSYICRTLRFYLILDKEIPIKDLFYIVCIHNFFNNILPARIGELSFVYLLKKYHSKKIGEGVASLVLVRVFDGIVVSLLFLISALFVSLPEFTVVELTPVFLLFILFVIAIFFKEHMLNLLRTTLKKIDLYNIKFIQYILTKFEETLEAFEKTQVGNHLLLLTLVLSICIWLTKYLVVFVLLLAMDLNSRFCDVIFASTFALLTTILPIQGIAGFGTLEGGWTVGFINVGLTIEEAVISGIIYHLIIIGYSGVLGCYGLLLGVRDK